MKKQSKRPCPKQKQKPKPATKPKTKLSPEEIARRKRFNEIVTRYDDLAEWAYPEQELV